MIGNLKYLVVNGDWNTASAKQNELLELLNEGYEIVSACGAADTVHYVLAKKLEVTINTTIVNKGGRPRKVAKD